MSEKSPSLPGAVRMSCLPICWGCRNPFHEASLPPFFLCGKFYLKIFGANWSRFLESEKGTRRKTDGKAPDTMPLTASYDLALHFCPKGITIIFSNSINPISFIDIGLLLSLNIVGDSIFPPFECPASVAFIYTRQLCNFILIKAYLFFTWAKREDNPHKISLFNSAIFLSSQMQKQNQLYTINFSLHLKHSSTLPAILSKH